MPCELGEKKCRSIFNCGPALFLFGRVMGDDELRIENQLYLPP